MKRKITIGLILFSLSFIVGGVMIYTSIEGVVSKLDHTIILHQVEIMRQNLRAQVKVVQLDLLLKDTPHPTKVKVFKQHMQRLNEAVLVCSNCHHQEEIFNKINHLKNEVFVYQKLLGELYDESPNTMNLTEKKHVAFQKGQHIIKEIDTIVLTSSEKLASRTQSALDDIAFTKKLLAYSLPIAPVVVIILAFFLFRQFTKQVSILVNAAKRFRTGDLSFKIEGLKDEFEILAESFNDMSGSLSEKIREIKETDKRYRLLFESAGDAIFIMDADGGRAGQIVSANKAAADMHGYTIDELLRLNISDLDTLDTAALIEERLERILNGEWINAEITHRKKDGTIFPMEMSAGLLEYDGHRHVLGIHRDITERKQAEEALQRSEQLMIVGEMAAGLAHEIKNPLAGIKVSIQVLSDELDLSEENEEVFRRIIEEIRRIETLLRNLLHYARPPKPNFSVLDVNRVIELTVKTAKLSLKGPTLKSKDIQFSECLSDDLPEIVADSSQLQQIFMNLLLNAFEAIPDSGKIMIDTSRENGFIKIVLANTGRSLEERSRQDIFKPFFTTKKKGTGLGLAICKRLIEQHNGAISVDNIPEGGVAFTITLPIKH